MWLFVCVCLFGVICCVVVCVCVCVLVSACVLFGVCGLVVDVVFLHFAIAPSSKVAIVLFES